MVVLPQTVTDKSTMQNLIKTYLYNGVLHLLRCLNITELYHGQV